MKTLKSRRGVDLLSERALAGLSLEEREELARLLANEGLTEDESIDLAAAAIDLAANPAPTEALPAALVARLERDGRRFLAEPAAVAVRTPAPVRPQASTTAAGAQVVVMPLPGETAPRRDWTRYSGWIAAAAAVCLIVGQKLVARPAPSPTPTDVRAASAEATPARARVLTGTPTGSASGPPATLAWSDVTSSGELRVRGLPAGRYELWLVDAGRADRPLAAGAFAASEGTEAVARVQSAIPPLRPSRLAVTRETSGADLVPIVTFTISP